MIFYSIKEYDDGLMAGEYPTREAAEDAGRAQFGKPFYVVVCERTSAAAYLPSANEILSLAAERIAEFDAAAAMKLQQSLVTPGLAAIPVRLEGAMAAFESELEDLIGPFPSVVRTLRSFRVV